MARLPSLLLMAVLALGAAAGPAPAGDLQYVASAYWSGACGVSLSGPYACCAYLNGLVILDVSDPQRPVALSRVYCEGGGRDVDVCGSYAFLAGDRAGLQIIDISDPHHPWIAASYDTPGEAGSVTVTEGFAYIADGPGSGLIILDVSDPLDPRFAGEFVPGGMCESVTIAGDYAYIGGVFGGLEIVDISDPCHPELATFYSMCSSDQVFIAGTTAYATGGCGGSRDWPDEYSILHIFDVSDPTQPFPLGEYVYYTGSGAGPVAVAGGHAFARYRDEEAGDHLLAIDVSDPAQPTLVGSAPLEGPLLDLQVRDGVLYAATSAGGIRTLDISAPAAPRVIGGWSEACGAAGIAGRDGWACLTDGPGGLRILDLVDPLAPRTLAHLPLPGYQGRVQLAGDVAALVDFSRALNLVDIRDSAQPRLIARILDDVRAAAIQGGRAYIAAGGLGLRIYDLALLEQPVLVGECDLPGYAWDVAVAEGMAYVCAFHEGLQIVDVSDPAHPVQRGAVSLEHEYLRSLALVGDYAYVPASNQHLLVFDISDPDHPAHVLTYPVNCLAGIRAVGDRLYLDGYDAEYRSGLIVLDIADRLDPRLVTQIPIPGGSRDVLVEGDHVCVAASGSLVILGPGASGAGGPAADPRPALGRLRLAATSPAAGSLSIRCELPATGSAALELYDLSGRRCATLPDPAAGPARGRLSWDWRAARLPVGTYFLRLRAAGGEASCPVTLVR